MDAASISRRCRCISIGRAPLVPKKRPEAPLLGEYLFFHLRWKKEKGGKPVKKQTMSRKRNALYRETKAGMEALGTYKSEFEAPIKRYVELRLQYDILNEKWYENDCQITEVYTNKAGAKNQRKTALYLALETMRRELTEMENVLGLTPKGLKLLKTKGLEKKKGGALAEALRKADGEV
ncbi:hypothetical protein DWV84_03170 [Blautia sp. AF13-16]|nr:P27 family phage terminase small subunit [Blautia producta]POP36631.1 hypothetical protein C3R19_19045 [Blautia producta]RHP73320.1 hypothetical protein DXA40_28240 [Blautia sp. OF01-4LB]RHS21420.1 hypothetical protein DWV84_03170 [Blautia sp. AF13-16]DAY61071.1 MAG TPA: terminase small subunit [Caudoviricetes sp.]